MGFSVRPFFCVEKPDDEASLYGTAGEVFITSVLSTECPAGQQPFVKLYDAG
jgi:hypothetical protein